MRKLRVLLLRALALVRARDLDRELQDEIAGHLGEATDEYLRQGQSPAEARLAALRSFGGVTRTQEAHRDARSFPWLDNTWRDLQYAVRMLRKTPSFTAIAVVTLALGIGANTAIFSAVYPILFEPLPYPNADRVAMIVENGGQNGGTFGVFHELAARSRSFETLSVFRRWQPTMTGGEEPERLEGQRVSADYFRVVGVSPLAGRDFGEADDRFHGPNVVILSDSLWRRRFHTDQAIVGQAIRLDDAVFTVVGVMPHGFENVLAPMAELWMPLQYDPSLPANGREWGHNLRTIGRLKPGVSMASASRETNEIGRAVIAERRPETYDPNTQFGAVPLQAQLTQSVRPALLIIFTAAALVLVIACVNVTNLLVARGVRRREEFALRAVLGAGRWRLVRQMLTESVLLAALGGAGGSIVAAFGTRALVALAPAVLPRAADIGLSASALAFTVVVTAAVGIAFGMIPAVHASRLELQGDLHAASRQTAARRGRSLLVVVEVALALMLLVASGLLLRSMEQLFAVPIGFEPSGLMTLQIQLTGRRYNDNATAFRFFDDAGDAVRRVPGIASVGMSSQLPLSGDRDEYGADFEATPTQPADKFPVFRYAISPGYLETMHIALKRGRLIDAHDSGSAPLVAVISESLARARFGSRDPVGQRLRVGPVGPFTIVGVVGDVHQLSLAAEGSRAVYLPEPQWRFSDAAMWVVFRARGSTRDAAASVRQAIWSLDSDLPIVRVASMDELMAATASERRFALVLFEAFAIAALLLSAAGIYGVLAGNVEERTREIGVRSALGASRADIVGLVLRQGMLLTGIGVAIGLAGAVMATGAMSAMLFSISRLDPPTYAGVVALLAAVSAIACAVPAWRAARVNPAITLRAE